MDVRSRPSRIGRRVRPRAPLTAQATCFADGGVLGRIPANRLYQPGLALLKWWPLPNIENVPDGQAFNYQRTDPPIDLLGWQPTVRVDYQPLASLRIGAKYLMYLQPNDVIPGSIPEWNDSGQDDYGIYLPSGSVNWSVSPTMFVEGAWGLNWHHQEGCTVVGGAPNFCRQGIARESAREPDYGRIRGHPAHFP